MLPLINGKSWLECTEEDLRTIIDCPEYAENDYLDYKKYFKPLLLSKEKTQAKQDAIAEFRSDVCAFANSNGGYLIFGIGEKDGIPHEICGIEIESKDKFELDIKNLLNQIKPRLPNIALNCISLENGKVVVALFVRHDSFAPYIHLENGNNYRIYKRTTNSNMTMSYSEIRNMFSQSIVLEKEIEQFRNERINFFRSQAEEPNSKCAQFMLLHIIPETFLDKNYDQPLFVLERKGQQFRTVFQSFECYDCSVPMIEGLRYPGYKGEAECRLLNNGVAEFFSSVASHFHNTSEYPSKIFFAWEAAWQRVERSIREYVDKIYHLFPSQRLFVGFSLIGCKGISSENNYFYDQAGIIDRNRLVMNTMAIDMENNSLLDSYLKRMKLDYMLSLGISLKNEVAMLIKEVYGE